MGNADIIERLEQAGATLMALPDRGHATGMRCGWPEVVRDMMDAYGWTEAAPVRLKPSAADITAMDEALRWILLIPSDRYVIRRIVGLRMLVRPLTGRHVWSLRKIARVIGANHKAVERWHDDGITIIRRALADRENNSSQMSQKMPCFAS